MTICTKFRPTHTHTHPQTYREKGTTNDNSSQIQRKVSDFHFLRIFLGSEILLSEFPALRRRRRRQKGKAKEKKARAIAQSIKIYKSENYRNWCRERKRENFLFSQTYFRERQRSAAGRVKGKGIEKMFLLMTMTILLSLSLSTPFLNIDTHYSN